MEGEQPPPRAESKPAVKHHKPPGFQFVSFSCGDLLDLALGVPEVGAVNFNILRMLLRELVEQMGIEMNPANISESETNQCENFKNYLEGMGVASPMPGVLRIGNQGPPPAMKTATSQVTPTATPRTTQADHLEQPHPVHTTPAQTSQKSPGRPPMQYSAHGPHTPRKSTAGPGGTPREVREERDDLISKVTRLERQLDALNELPSNMQLIMEAKTGRGETMSVSEMWQIIQLNNRIAAAEAAIQKMASLIEDLARNVGKVKTDTKNMKTGTQGLQRVSSDLQASVEKYKNLDDVLSHLKGELMGMKAAWKQDRDYIERVLGIDLGKVPSFMKAPSMLQKVPHPHHHVTITSEPEVEQVDSHEVSTQTFAKGKPQKEIQAHTPEDIKKMTPDDILQSVDAHELTMITPELYRQLNPEQKRALGTIRRSIKLQPDWKRPLGVDKMTDEELAQLTPAEILEKMSFEEAIGLSEEVLARMTDEQREMVQEVIKRGPAKKVSSRRDLKMAKKTRSILHKAPAKLGVISMTREQLAHLTSAEIARRMNYDEAKQIPPNVLQKMPKSVQDAIQRILDEGPPPDYTETEGRPILGIASMTPNELKQLTVKDIEGMSLEEAKNLPPEVVNELAPELQEALKRLLEMGESGRPTRESVDDGDEDDADKPVSQPPRLTLQEIEMVAEIPAYEIAETLGPEIAAMIPEDEMKKRFTHEQIHELEKLRKKSGDSATPKASQIFTDLMAELGGSGEGEGEEEEEEEEEQEGEEEQQEKKETAESERRESSAPVESEFDQEATEDGSEGGGYRKSKSRGRGHKKRAGKEYKKHKKGRGRREKTKSEGSLKPPTAEEVVPVEEKPPLTLEEYLSSLSPEEAANIAADAVQREMEKQFRAMQGMQRQLAQDIQEKMEYVYNKLLKEIASQQLTLSPFTVRGEDTCWGPGVCDQAGMPAGITACQGANAEELEKQKSTLPGHGQRPESQGKSNCPGPGECPGPDVCPYCIADAAAKLALRDLGTPVAKSDLQTGPGAERRSKSGAPGDPSTTTAEMDESILEEMRNLMLLDLDKIRQDMKSQKLGTYDEQDILERLGAVWEAMRILKNNEESLALKLARHDVLMKKFPPKALEKIQKIPDENWEALITGDFGKFTHSEDHKLATKHDGGNLRGAPMAARGSIFGIGGEGGGGASSAEIKALYENLAHVIGECAEQKERIDQIADTARVLESAMVTKRMMDDAISDKADRGLINTKVSYDEFGSTVEELNLQLHNLMVDGFQRNEHWKKVTADLASEINKKLDRVELAPLRAFFKSRVEKLEGHVGAIVKYMDEPDPAGTRKKFLKDHNCLSCDRSVNIAGRTNGPILPVIEPMPPGRSTAPRRTFDLKKQRGRGEQERVKIMESKSKLGYTCGMKEKSLPGILKKQELPPDGARISSDMDVMHIVNRYTGGSHTVVTTQNITDAMRRHSQNFHDGKR